MLEAYLDKSMVTPSRHSLYFRGFSSKVNVEDVRRYFKEKEGNCSVDFFSYAMDNRYLNVALRFDTHEIAKEVMHKYQDNMVLGFRVSVTWFKDMQKAREKIRNDPEVREKFLKHLNTSGRGGPGRPSQRDYFPHQPPYYDRVSNGDSRPRTYRSISRSRSRSPRRSSRSASRSRSHHSYQSSLSRSPVSSRSNSPAANKKKKKDKKKKRRHDGSSSKKNNSDSEVNNDDSVVSRSPSQKEKEPDTAVPKRVETLTSFTSKQNDVIDTGKLSPENLSKMKTKKEEIEKAYKQDCETFSVVVKMLLSKVPDLEERLHAALKDTLREIGQQCIEELRDYTKELVQNQDGGGDKHAS